MSNYAGEIPRIALWFFEEWRSLYGNQSLPSVQRRIESWLTQDRIPTSLVAVLDEHVVGTVALKLRELPEWDYGPWLAGLFVVPGRRHGGIGARLVEAAEQKAASLGVERLHLYTPTAQEFYERRGWTVTTWADVGGKRVSIMAKSLPRP